MDIGGRIPPLLEALALQFRRILPWFVFFVMNPLILAGQKIRPGESRTGVGQPRRASRKIAALGRIS